jgi:hypothetical protein
MRTRQRTTVADVMTTAVVTVPPYAPVPEVASTLFVAAVRAVPVLRDEGDLLGVISEPTSRPPSPPPSPSSPTGPIPHPRPPSPYDHSPNDATRSAVTRRPLDMREV